MAILERMPYCSTVTCPMLGLSMKEERPVCVKCLL